MLLNQQQAADALGVSTQYLSKLKRQGRIAPDASGKYELETLRAQIRAGAEITQAMAAQTRAERRAVVEPPAPMPELPQVSEEIVYTGDHHEDFKIARAAREREMAAIARIDRLEAEKRACLVQDVERQAYTEARRLRDTLLGAFPTKLAPRLLQAGQDVFALEHLLREALREALAELVQDMEGAHAAG